MLYRLGCTPRFIPRFIAFIAVVFLFATLVHAAHAQTTDPLAQQWADKRVELERLTFLRQSWQISDSEWRQRTGNVNNEIRDIGSQLAKLPAATQAQIRQQSDSVFTVVIVPLRQQWQQQKKEREAKIRADIATDAKAAADLQANRTLLNEKLQRKEIAQGDFSNRDQSLQQQLVAMQNKWASVDPGWGNFFAQSWQGLMQTALADLRKKEAAAQTPPSPPQKTDPNSKLNDDDVRTAVGLSLEIQHNIFLRDKQAITPAEEQKRDAGSRAQVDAIQAKYTGNAAKDFVTRVSGLVDAGVLVRKPRWEQEVSAGPANPPPTTTTTSSNGDGSTPPTTPPIGMPGGHTNPPAPQPGGGTGSNRTSKAYLKEMPDPARIVRDIQSSDPAVMASCQMGAFTWLKAAVYQMNGMTLFNSRNEMLSAEEQRLVAEYDNARAALMRSPYDGDAYSFDDRYGNYVVQRFFPPGSAIYRANFNPRFPPLPCGSLATAGTQGSRKPSVDWLGRLQKLVLPLVALMALGGVGYFVYRQRLKIAPVPSYREVKNSYSTPAPVHTDSVQQRRPPSPVAGRIVEPGNFKQQLFAEEREKYQLRYNEVVDEMTDASSELTQMNPILEGVQSNLKLLSKTVVSRLNTLVRVRYGNTGKLLLKSALKGLIGTVVVMFVLMVVAIAFPSVLPLNSPILTTNASTYSIYIIVTALLFYRARRRQAEIPLTDLKNNADAFKNVGLAFVYEDQLPEMVDGRPLYHAMQISATKPTVDDIRIPVPGDGATIQPRAFLLTFPDLAYYRVEHSGNIALGLSNSGSGFVNAYGAFLTQAVVEQRGFASTTLPPLTDYIRVAGRKRKAAEMLPQLEKLIQEVDRLEMLWRDVYTSEKVFEFLLKRIDLFNMRDSATPPGILLHGSAGNGKGYLARKIADSVSARFEEVNGARLTSPDEVKTLWDKNRGKSTVVLFIQNAERVFPRPGSENAGGGTREATMAFMQEWEKQEAFQSRVWVVMSAENNQELHPSVLGQFSDSKIEIAAPDTAGRETILQVACKENRIEGSLPGWIARETAGRSIRELRDIVKGAKRQSTPNLPNEAHWREAIRNLVDAPEVEGGGWKDLIVAEDTLNKLKTVCESLRSLDSLQKQGIQPPRGALFSGLPGTGKTQIARTLAKESGLPFIAAAPADLKAGYIGQSGQKVQQLFAKARGKAPCILFIDEFDSSAAARGGPHADQFTDEIVNGLLAAMDGVQKSGPLVFVVAATNFLERLDPAIVSRFTYKIEIPMPDEKQRTSMFKIFLGRQKQVDFNIDEVSAELAHKAGKISGRDIDNLVRSASQHALERAFAAGTSDRILLTKEDLLVQLSPKLKEISEEELQKIWSKIVLKPQVKETILSKIRTFNRGDKAAPGGLLLYGPPGTGKSEIARRIAESTNSGFESLTVSDLKAGYVGQNAQKVKQRWDKVRAHGRCVMFVDECEGVFGRRGGLNTDSFAEELVQEFLAQWDGLGSTGQVWVIGATNRKDLIDDAIMSRFGTAYEIELPEAPERLQILRLEMQKLERDVEIPEFVGRATTGSAGRALKNLARDVCNMAEERSSAITPEIWKEVIARTKRNTGEGGNETDTWDKLVISPETLRKLKTVCESLKSIESLRKRGMDLPRGAILHGPPGTGKTQIARTLANESGLPFLSANPADMKAAYVGQSGQKVREVFERARTSAPCILFIDEFDASAPARGGAHADQFTNEIVDELLTQMDGIKKKTDRHIFVLAATNYLDRIDEAAAARFTFKIEVPNPTLEQRVQLFKIFLGQKPVNFNIDEAAPEFARKAGSIGGRAIADIVTAASQRALERAFETGTSDEIVITLEDVTAQLSPQLKEVSEDDLQKIWSQIVLKPDVKQAILSKVRMFNSGDKATPRGLLLYGPPGTGKTEIARKIADSANCGFEALSIASLKAGYVGQSAQLVKQVWDKARSRGRFVIFVDECEGVFGRRGGLNADAFSEEIVQEFLAQWDGVGSKGQIWVIGATNRRDRLDEAIVSRFGAAFEVGLPEAAERLEILRLAMRKMDRNTEIPEFVGALTTGLSGRGLLTLASDICTMAADQKTDIHPEMWRDVIARNIKVSSESVADDARWDSLVLPETTLKNLKTVCDSMKNAEILAKQNIDPLRGALLYGPPGTGKTQIARTLANESGVAFIAAGPADLKAGYVGQSVQKVNELFERARDKAPCILFIDEIEACAADRNGPNADQFTNEIVTELLRQMDGVKKTSRYVFVLAATNHPKLIDSAILSRFEEKIEIANPGLAERTQLFKVFLRKYRVDFDVDAMAGELSAACGDIGGRDIQSIVKRASQLAVQRAFATGTVDNVVLKRDDLMGQLPKNRTEGASRG